MEDKNDRRLKAASDSMLVVDLKDRPLKIEFISYHCCIRVIKEYLALTNTGEVRIHSTRLFSIEMPADSVLPIANHGFYVDKITLMQLLKHSQFDIYHCHNEPMWFPALVRHVKPEAKIVLDVHDSDFMRDGEIGIEEREQFDSADAFIFPSKTYQVELSKAFNLEDRPQLVVYSMCNEFLIEALVADELSVPREPGIVYEGGALANPEDWASKRHYPKYRDHIEIVKELTANGIPFYMFGTDPKYIEAYVDAGATVFGRMPYGGLMKELGAFDWGFVGTDCDSPQSQSAMANKMFEYVAAGIPVIVMNSKEMGAWVEKHGVGVHIKSTAEIPDIYHLHKELRPVVQEKRGQFTMENQVTSILEFYWKVLGLEYGVDSLTTADDKQEEVGHGTL